MNSSLNEILKREFKLLFVLNKTERLWHIPVLASLCTGLPLLTGYCTGHVDFGVLACLGGLVILYLPSTSLEHRMVNLMLCSFGFIISFAIGLSFSFNAYLSALVLGLYSFGANWASNYFKLSSPGSFFFIMIAAMASCMPFNLDLVPVKIGLLAIGTIFACVMALLYSLYITKKYPSKLSTTALRKHDYANLAESAVMGLFIGLSLFTGHLLKLDNPYWIPVSCLAIMQGVSITHVWQRSIHRITGTLVGICLTWLLVQLNLSALTACLSILVLQFVVEMLIVRHYALAAIFFTPMSIFLSELARGAVKFGSDTLVFARLTDIIIGSVIGIIGGILLHNRYLHQQAEYRLNKSALSRK